MLTKDLVIWGQTAVNVNKEQVKATEKSEVLSLRKSVSLKNKKKKKITEGLYLSNQLQWETYNKSSFC